MDDILEIPQIVVNKDTDIKYHIMSINLVEDGKESNNSFPISYSNFVVQYNEYIDPKDIEIKRLKGEILKLKEKNKKERKPRRVLTPEEREEIRILIKGGENNTVIGDHMGIGNSAVSRIRIEMRKEGLDV